MLLNLCARLDPPLPKVTKLEDPSDEDEVVNVAFMVIRLHIIGRRSPCFLSDNLEENERK